tara:strand:+ start:175 stop:942 length:768 start_codon:yes stop_codon:yes gene_type:complete
MEKNGLEHRFRERKIGLWIASVSGFFFFSFFFAPFILPEGTVVGLNGRANSIDFASTEGSMSYGNSEGGLIHKHADGSIHYHEHFTWSELDPYTGFIYAFGDLNCHQNHERSWEIGGNQMPVCTRDVGIFFGLMMGGVVFSRRAHNRWTVRDTCLSLVPDEWLGEVYVKNQRTLAWLACGVALCVPLIIDGFTQLLTSYESNNLTRPLTGAPFGLGLAILIGASIAARAEKFSSAGAVLLPGGAKFQLQTPSEEE